MSEYSICLDIGGTKVLGAVFNEKKEIVFRLKKKIKGSDKPENVEELIASVVQELLEKGDINLKSVRAIAAGAPGVVDADSGIILFSPNLPWRNYKIAEQMKKRFDRPFYIGNDVNVGVLGEWHYGVAKGYSNIVGLFPGTGVGGGLILDNHLYTGNEHKAAELGHISLNTDGPVCGCGQRGCLEIYSSKVGMTDYIRQQISRGRKTMMQEYVSDGVFKSKKMKEAYFAGDEVMQEAVRRAGHYLAVGCGTFINIFSPEMIVFGGGIIEAMGDVFLELILNEVDAYSMPSIREKVAIEKAALGDDSVLFGALSMIK